MKNDKNTRYGIDFNKWREGTQFIKIKECLVLTDKNLLTGNAGYDKIRTESFEYIAMVGGNV